MARYGTAVFAAALMTVAALTPTWAQVQTPNQNPVFVPGAPNIAPPPPPVTNPQPPGAPPRLDTYSDRVTRCLHYGGAMGLQGGERDAYVRACAN